MDGAPLIIGPKDNRRRARAFMCTAGAPELLVVDEGKLVSLLNEQEVGKHCPTSAILLEEK